MKMWLMVVPLLLAGMAARASAAEDSAREFFEARIRPVLVEQCYECHNSHDKTEGGLALDSRETLLEGGNSGKALVPGKPEASLLIKAIGHQKASLRMPKGGGRLPDAVVADFVKWVRLGAPDPRDNPPDAKELEALTSWDAIRERRQQWWSFRPVVKPALPNVHRCDWSEHPIDRFILARLEQEKLEPAARADRATLIRRVTFALTGLPPTPAEIDRFVNDTSPRAYEHVVDRLLQSPRFGERWARHWMDWFRYSETHGSEGDPTIPHAWRYREYLIRALNDDVPHDRLVREHLAGDLLPDPRINRALQINESALGIAHYRMVQHGYAPTDALDEQVTFTDNQIDVLTKAFLGLTVSCARCHNHKFDPISQTDFYALYGIMASSRPALITVDTPERLNTHRAALERLRSQIKPKLAEAWTRALDELPRRLEAPDSRGKAAIEEAKKNPGHPLHAWAVLRGLDGKAFEKTWAKLQADWEGIAKQRAKLPEDKRWDLTGPDYQAWFKHGNGLPETPSPPGEFHVLSQGEQVIANVYPAGVYTHRLSNKHNGVLTSPRFNIDSDWVSVRVAGGDKSRVRLVVQNYPRFPGLLYPVFEPTSDEPRWHRWDVRYWKGEWAYIEVATSEDLPIEVKPTEGRSWFGISAAALGDRREETGPDSPLFAVDSGAKPKSSAELAGTYATAMRAAIKAWSEGTMTDPQAGFLGVFVRARLLPNTLETLPELASLVAEYRRLEAEVPVPTRAPGVLEATGFDQPLFVRGNHKKPGDPVPRRFLEAFGSEPYKTTGSGRRELADDFVNPRNPLTSRVVVNRLWHHLFGRGIVATTDNFGRLGDLPSHPELLDFLASEFVDDGRSIKRMIRRIVTSETYQLSDRASKEAAERDPDNVRLSHFPVRRLEAEAIRDAILAVSGQLVESQDGLPVSGQSRRRSVYVNVRRTNLDPFLSAFDVPEPLSTRGRRDTTNVPAQSLTLLNDPWVIEQALRWAESVARDPSLKDDSERIRRMFLTALGRAPSAEEREQCLRFLADEGEQRERLQRETERRANEIRLRQKRIASVRAPVRQRLASRTASPELPSMVPVPIARWEFDHDLRDALGTLHGTSQGHAVIEDGALVLDGQSHVQTAPLARPLSEKTLEAWVMLDDLDQRGGGVMSIETIGGGEFDSIVIGEMNPRLWMAGSNFFHRTQPFHATPEAEAIERPVHLALVYQADGTIVGYRNGQPYGTSYKTDGPLRFEPARSHVVFGLRHSPAGGNKMLRGKILRAQLYDRALRPEEVAASAAGLPGYLPESKVLAALSASERADVERWKREIDVLNAEQAASRSSDERPTDEVQRWRDLAHSLFNFKEFLYVR